MAKGTQEIRRFARIYATASDKQRARSDAKNNVLFTAKGARRDSLLAARERCRSVEDALALADRAIPGGTNQNQDELSDFVAYVAQTKPKTYVEVGTERGATNLVITTSIPSLELSIGVDLFVLNRLRLERLSRARFVAIDGNSRALATLRAVKEALGGKSIDLLFIDGDHSFEGALLDWRTYRPLVADGGLIAFHDIAPDQLLRESGRTTRSHGGNGGEVPILWDALKSQFESREFISQETQLGRGIGVLRQDSAIREKLVA